jgi:hypothetical protein
MSRNWRAFTLCALLSLVLAGAGRFLPASLPQKALVLAPTVPAGEALNFGSAEVGGHSLAYLCRGHGAPAVIIDDALGVPGLESGGWGDVVDAIAPLTRICVYDRAGLGLSRPAPEDKPRTSQAAVDDLAALLAAVPVMCWWGTG